MTASDDAPQAISVRWCQTHDDVALVYGDGSVSCRWELVVEAHTDDHELVELPEVDRLRSAIEDVADLTDRGQTENAYQRCHDALEADRG